MITQAKCKSLIDLAVKHARKRVDGIEVLITASNVATSRFANNGMTQNQSPEHVEIQVRVLSGKRQLRLSSDQLGVAAIKALVDKAITGVGLLAEDPKLQPLVSQQTPGVKGQLPHKLPSRCNRRTARFAASDRAEAVNAITYVAKSKGLQAAGVVATGTLLQALGNSAGVFRFHQETSAECSITMLHKSPVDGSESTGWSKAHSTNVADIDAKALAERAAQKAIASANPKEIAPGSYTVIMEPSAVLDLVWFVLSDFTGTSHQDKLSCFTGKVGQKLLGNNITITDDPYHPLQAGAPFDGEGLWRQPVTLVENGTIKGLVYGRRSAAALGAVATGHGLPEPSPEGEFPANMVVAGGKSSLEDMIKSTKRGILLTRVWYVRDVDPVTKIVTGMTRDGTFLIEDGVITGGIRNLRFNQSLLAMLKNVEMLGEPVRAAGEEGQPAVVPAMKVNGFNFASTTRF